MPQTVYGSIQLSDKKIGYSSEDAEKLDQAYVKLQQGVIPNFSASRLNIQDMKITAISDNYIFLRRHFSSIQLYWVLFIRLITLHNPFKEVVGFIKSVGHTRISFVTMQQEILDDFKDFTIKEKTLVSVIIPTLNRYDYLSDVLKDLEVQTYKNFEVIICDQSEPVDELFYANWDLNLKLIIQEEKALWLARNRSIQRSKGDYILLFDDDSRVDKNWIESHLMCIEYFNAKVSAGVTHTLIGGGLGRKDKYFHLSDVFDTGNALVHRSVFRKIGLFDRQFEKQRMGDAEFGLRASLNGFHVISNPIAKRLHLKVETGGLRQMGSWDALRPKKLFSPRPIPSVLYLIRNYFGSKEAVLFILKNIPLSYVPYRYKGNKIAKVIVYCLFVIWLPFAIISVLQSWLEASKKLKIGSIISRLET